MLLALNLATCMKSQQDETAALARLGDCTRTHCDAVTDMMNEEREAISALLKRRTQKLN